MKYIPEIITCVSLSIFPLMGIAQTDSSRVVKGRVLSALTSEPLSGAIVSSSETGGYSTLTGDDGTYTLKLPRYVSQLEIHAPDMNMVKVGIAAGDSQRDVKLFPSVFTPDYDKSTNVLSSSHASDFSYSSAVTIEEEVQKKLGADVHTVTRNGTPGIGAVMFISGLNSLNVNAQPLIIVDDVIFDQQYGRTMLHDGFYNDILSNINPADIEKVTVLRNGTALYGAKGANGVILIQTRRCKSMATRITASVSAGVTLEPKFIDMMDASQYKSYASDLMQSVNTDITDFKFLNDDPTYYYYPQYHNDTDWKKLIYRTAFTQNYGVNVEGGDDIASYNLSLGYINSQSTLKYNSMNRINIRFNTDISLTKTFSARFDASFANQTRDLRNDGAPESYDEGTPSSPSFLAYVKSPMLSPYTYANGILSDSYLDINDETYLDEALAEYNNYNYKLANPAAINVYGEAENKNRFENSMVNLSISPKYQFNDHLFAKEHFSYNLTNTSERYYIPMSGVPDYYVSSVGAFRENETRSLFSKQNSVMSDTRIDWNNSFEAHALHLFGGVLINWESYKYETQLGYNTGNDKTPFMSSSLLNAQTTGLNDSWNSVACYAQAEYNYLQRYYLHANLTAEGSSRFGDNTGQGIKLFDASWGIFPGVQAAWVITAEPWSTKWKGIDYIRLSAGFDMSGNDDIDYYASRSYFRAIKFLESIAGLAFDNIGNTGLQWETTKRFNLGLEGDFLENRLNVRANFFHSVTDHLLMFQSLGYLSGLEKNWTNGGALKNNGFDITMIGKLIAAKDFQLELGVSAGHYVNEVTELTDNQQSIETTVYGATVLTKIGQPANLFYGYKSLGVFSTSEEASAAGLYILADNGITKNYFAAGDVHFDDLNGDNIIDEDDRTIIGDPNPDIYGNIFSTIAYKRFRLDVNFNYSLGGDVYNYTRQQLESGSRFLNQTTAVTNRWQTEGQQTDVPRVTFQDPMGNSRFSDRWIEDGSYLKLKTVTLSYTLPVSSTFFQGFEFWLQGGNLLTFTKYLGSDPEFTMTSAVIGQGIDLGQLPQSRNIVAGIKINL